MGIFLSFFVVNSIVTFSVAFVNIFFHILSKKDDFTLFSQITEKFFPRY